MKSSTMKTLINSSKQSDEYGPTGYFYLVSPVTPPVPGDEAEMNGFKEVEIDPIDKDYELL